MSRLSASTLNHVLGADTPSYDRSTPPSVVHLGVGAFARAHLATYADDLLTAGWPATIRGVSLRARRAEDQLGPQDGLFSLTTREPDLPPTIRVVGSITSVATGIEAACDAISSPSTKLVTLTVTEKGYEPDGPDSVPALLADALAARRTIADAPVVVASLDNVLDNGVVLRDNVLRAADAVGGDLRSWITEHVAFPRSVVDRMVPATTDADREEIAVRLGVVDEAAVVAEAHRSWVIESVEGLPPLERVGVEVVDHIEPYQRRKLWLLNGPHSATAYTGLLAGHGTIADAVSDPIISRFVGDLTEEVIAVASMEALSPMTFAEGSLRRFENSSLGHTCVQVAADGSRKLPQRLLPVMELRRSQGLPTERFDLVCAAWLVATTGTPAGGHELPAIEDPAASSLREALHEGGVEAAVHTALGEDHGALHDGVADAFHRVVREGVHALEEVA